MFIGCLLRFNILLKLLIRVKVTEHLVVQWICLVNLFNITFVRFYFFFNGEELFEQEMVRVMTDKQNTNLVISRYMWKWLMNNSSQVRSWISNGSSFVTYTCHFNTSFDEFLYSTEVFAKSFSSSTNSRYVITFTC